ncbi:MAG: PAS domain-containing protein [Nitrospira sp.]|nr:PAS domain-containing protein [Nitrospira sp.]
MRSLHISDELWAFALEGNSIGLWDWNVTTNRVVCSDGWNDLFGYTPGDAGDHFDEWCSLIHSDDLSKAQVAMQRLVQGESPMCATEYRIRCKDGAYKWIVARGKVFSRTPDGAPLRILGTHADITEQKELKRWLTLQHKVVDVLTSVSGLDAAISAILKPVCETLGWEEGLLWVVDESTQRLRCHLVWTAPWVVRNEYGTASREMMFPMGIGLPGRVWASAKPEWISDVTRDRNFPRAALAEQAGLHTAAAFPVRAADCVYAVWNFSITRSCRQIPRF